MQWVEITHFAWSASTSLDNFRRRITPRRTDRSRVDFTSRIMQFCYLRDTSSWTPRQTSASIQTSTHPLAIYCCTFSIITEMISKTFTHNWTALHTTRTCLCQQPSRWRLRTLKQTSRTTPAVLLWNSTTRRTQISSFKTIITCTVQNETTRL